MNEEKTTTTEKQFQKIFYRYMSYKIYQAF